MGQQGQRLQVVQNHYCAINNHTCHTDREAGARPPFAGFVLAGGKSTRMGQDKAALSLNGRTLLEHSLAALQGVCHEVAILGKYELYGTLAPVYEDIFPGCGPLGGIHAALANSHTHHNLIIAVDTPFLAPEFLSYLVERAI